MYTAGAKTGIETTFFGKVMTFFALAMLISAGGAYVGGHYLLNYYLSAPGLIWIVYIAELVLIFTSRMWSRRAPLNRVLFAAFAFLSGLTVGPLIFSLTASAAGAAILTKALGATGAMFAATAIIGYTTQRDLSGMRGFLLTSLIGLIIVGVIGIFIPWSNTMELVYSGFGVLVFSAFTAYDFQRLKHYPQDAYIDAALNLYLDIFNLFLMLLRLLTGLSRN